MKSVPRVIDDNFDLNLHGRQGLTLSIFFENDDGTPRSMAGRTVTFECGTTTNIVLTPGSSSDELVLTITNAQLKTIYADPNRDYVLLDSTAGSQPTPLWQGTVYIYGWIE